MMIQGFMDKVTPIMRFGKLARMIDHDMNDFREAVRTGRTLHDYDAWIYFGIDDDHILYWNEGTEPPPRATEVSFALYGPDLEIGPRRRSRDLRPWWMSLANWTGTLGMTVLFGLWFLSALFGWIGRRVSRGRDGDRE